MTADADLARLLWHIHGTKASVVLVGDHRQLPSVGPGGALAAVTTRHPHIVTTIDDNVRQVDPDERRALAQLHHGDIDTAIRFYAHSQRITFDRDPTETLGGMVRAWAADTQAGHDTLMLAWRRRSVAQLNRLARHTARQLGWLTGEDLQAPGGCGYAVGDQVVTLAPNHDAGLVTCQRARVTDVDHRG